MGDIILTLDNYSIYKSNGYYMCVANQEMNIYQMFVGFADRELTTLSDDQVVDEIKKISELLFSNASDVIYVLPMINASELQRVASINDDKIYDRFLNIHIKPVTFDINQKFTSKNKRIKDVIGFVKQNDVDKKVIQGIDMSITRELIRNNMNYNGTSYIQEVDVELLKRNNGIREISYLDTQDNIFPTQEKTSGIAPINREYEVPVMDKENKLVRRLIKPNAPNNGSSGFSSMKFIVMILSIIFLAGVAVAAWLIK